MNASSFVNLLASQAAPVTQPSTQAFQWLVDLFRNDSIAHAVLILALVAALGLAIGTIKVYRIGLGVAGVLFAGLLFGHMGYKINPEILEFAREFGLILFVYTIGVQVGPGFLASLRKQGLPLNIMAASIVVLGALITLGIYFLFMDRENLPAAVGLFSGATTNTPSLGAARQALQTLNAPTELLSQPGIAYAVAYPFGIIGIILAMLLIRGIFRVDLNKESQALSALGAKQTRLQTMNLEVRNPNLDGLTIKDVPALGESGVVISRIMRDNRPQLPHGDTVIHKGDLLLAVGPQPALEKLKLIIGAETEVDLKAIPSHITSRRILVTKSQALGKTIQDIDPLKRFGVVVTRVSRAEIELPPTNAVKLQFGDNLVVVGDKESIDQVAQELGDSPKRLNHPQVIPVFVGIVLGVIVGSWPLSIPGVPAPVRLGLAGGPLIVAIILSRLGNIGPLVWYMPISANFLLREVGIVLFLATVGLNSGAKFWETLSQGPGLLWMAYGAAITFIPLMIVGLVARALYKVNYMTLCGLLSGSMTDPPALAFAGSLTSSEAPSISYATVYPLVMLLRVLLAQAIVLFFYSYSVPG